MKVVHSIGNKKISKDTKGNNSFLITNKRGGYCFLGNYPSSRYQGVFFNIKGRMYKVIENIKVTDDSKIKELINNFWEVKRKRDKFTETFFMPSGYDSIVYETNEKKEIELVLDIRESYKNPEFGRIYDIYEQDNKLIIHYVQENEFDFFIAINKNSYQKTGTWFEQHYSSDKERNSPPDSKHVFSALKIDSDNLVMSFSDDKEKAIKENDFILSNYKSLKQKQKDSFLKDIKQSKALTQIKKSKKNDFFFAYLCAYNSLNSLLVNKENMHGIYAGLPWFFQFWERDELISLKALIIMKRFHTVRKLLHKNIKIASSKIALLNNEKTLLSADAPGWLFQRLHDFKKHLSHSDNIKIKKRLDDYINQIVKKRTLDNFALNRSKETWMDSLERSGIRIEIQALRLAMYDLMHVSTKQKIYEYLKHKLARRVKEKFWNKKYLNDGINDPTIRSNVFIAHYIYPKLLSKKEWTLCFKEVIPKLWCSWGGISTINKDTLLYCKEHTGEEAISYHNGDSWFWINNLSAISLHKLDKDMFKDNIKKILESSTNEILWMGIVGHHTELSSSIELRSQGCLAQAWSAAMYIELIDELFK